MSGLLGLHVPRLGDAEGAVTGGSGPGQGWCSATCLAVLLLLPLSVLAKPQLRLIENYSSITVSDLL